MLKLAGIALPLDDEPWCRGGMQHRTGPLLKAAAKALGVPEDAIGFVSVLRRSVDARRKKNVHFVANLAVSLKSEDDEEHLRSCGFDKWRPYEPLDIPFSAALSGTGQDGRFATVGGRPSADGDRPVVVGTGPAGLFAALYLARAGLCPVVVERGARVEKRAEAVRRLNAQGVLDLQSNIQFGEGGAGTFSDGKLTTGIKSPFASHVLHIFVEAGAPEEILWQAKPHMGSDRLPAVVASLRDQIVRLGGSVLFETQLVDLCFEGGHLSEIVLAQPTKPDEIRMACTRLVLACGHSARDTFALLQERGVHLEQKPFAVGVRIEHEQEAINRAQWGPAARHPALGAADYKMAVHGCAGRSVFTFCMCPGGEVVCAASEEEGVATNGASPFARDGRFANAALLVNVVPQDFEGGDRGSHDPLAGVRFQQAIERRAWASVLAAGGAPYQIPAQSAGSFAVADPADCAGPLPANSCTRGAIACDLRGILPGFVGDALAAALPLFDRKLAGFADPNAVLLGPETRSSSPLRIARNDQMQAWLEGGERAEGCGIFPAGEGAGYAGGIMSAACDGLRVATNIVRQCEAASLLPCKP